MAGVWLGVLLGVALLAAPAAFAVLSKELAGALVGRLFAQEAALSLFLPLLFVMGLRGRGEADTGPALSLATDVRLWAALGALLCTVLGYYALQPMMASARAGQGPLSFGALHGLSAMFYGIKVLLVLLLTWRLSC